MALYTCYRRNTVNRIHTDIAGVLLILSGSLLFADTLASGNLISPEKAKKLLDEDKSVILLDVRTADEFAAGHIANAKLLPYDEITASSAASAISSKNATILVYCRTGHRSAIAAKKLQELGYKTVLDLGGIVKWPYEIVK